MGGGVTWARYEGSPVAGGGRILAQALEITRLREKEARSHATPSPHHRDIHTVGKRSHREAGV